MTNLLDRRGSQIRGVWTRADVCTLSGASCVFKVFVLAWLNELSVEGAGFLHYARICVALWFTDIPSSYHYHNTAALALIQPSYMCW